MTRYLLDMNVISDIMRNPEGRAARALRRKAGADIGMSLVVKGEIVFGLARNGNARGRHRFEALLKAIEVWAMPEAVADVYGELRVAMEKSGNRTDANDLWIAAHALSLEATLVSDDRHFLSVPGLKVENWVRP